MKLSTAIVGRVRRIVKALESWVWFGDERAAGWVLTHSHDHVKPGVRLRHAARSEAWKKAPVVRYRAWFSTADRN